MELFEDLQRRGLVNQATPGLREALGRPLTAYVGFDPTAASLHVGSLVPLLALVRLQRALHRPLAVIGGGTGLIGDPSGKQSERSMLSADQIARNKEAMRAQLERLLEFGGDRGATLLDNADWLGEARLLEFLRDVGKHFTVNQMLARDAVRPRIEDPERWISFTEFSYTLLQAYDYLVLFDRHQCTLQLGGSDQWGNIVSGCDLVRRLRGAAVHGLTLPLVTKADGAKFGKTEQGNVWLDPHLTSPYEFHQFWLNTADDDAIRFLHYFTFLSVDAIRDLGAALAAQPQQRQAQRELAREVTALVHGDAARQRVEQTARVLFGDGDWRTLSAQQLAEAFAGAPRTALPREQLDTAAAGLAAVLATSGLSSSRGQAREAIRGGGVWVNDTRVTDLDRTLRRDDLLAGRYIVLRRGKKAYHVVDVC